MAITTYSELQTAVANWINRTDLTDRIPEFIALAEAHFNRKIRVPEMEEGLSETISTETLALPTDFLQVRSIYLDRDPDRELQYIPYGTLRALYGSATTGIPEVYTIADGSFVFAPVPNASFTLKGVYWEKIPALSISNTSNWLLASHPDMYLYGALVHAADYIREEGQFSKYVALTEGLIAGLEQQGIAKVAGGSPLVATRRGTIWGPSSGKGVW